MIPYGTSHRNTISYVTDIVRLTNDIGQSPRQSVNQLVSQAGSQAVSLRQSGSQAVRQSGSAVRLLLPWAGGLELVRGFPTAAVESYNLYNLKLSIQVKSHQV